VDLGTATLSMKRLWNY